MLHDILVGIDGSPASAAALDRAIELARDGNARLTLLTAVDRVPTMAAVAGDAVTVMELTRDLERQALERLEASVDRVPADIPVTKIVSLEPVPRALLGRVATGGHDLVVLGARRRGRLRRLLTGSLSRHVARRCEVPVLVVGADGTPASESKRPVVVARPEEILT